MNLAPLFNAYSPDIKCIIIRMSFSLLPSSLGEILSMLEVRVRESGDKSRTKFSQQRVSFVSNYLELLTELKVDREIHGNGIFDATDQPAGEL
mmetsp:Transcript_7626/g.10821  ORF Transcript_7626/g.10821 Transcript_7626/m.10821 type:complete len:93 (-) Transcript_7626:23-301(-)